MLTPEDCEENQKERYVADNERIIDRILDSNYPNAYVDIAELVGSDELRLASIEGYKAAGWFIQHDLPSRFRFRPQKFIDENPECE